MLAIGSKGPVVAKLQSDLNRLLPSEMPKLATDGIFGPKTRDRVCKFQSRNPLQVDGIVGPKTQARIQALSGPGTSPSLPGAPPNAADRAKHRRHAVHAANAGGIRKKRQNGPFR